MRKFFLMVVAALIVPACSGESQERASVTSSNQREANTESHEPQIITLSGIPAAQDATNLVLTTRDTGDGQTGFSEARWRRLWASARPVSATDPMISEWSYSPWLEGSFATNEGTYRFTIYLGGLGKLITANGQIGFFLVDAASGAEE